MTLTVVIVLDVLLIASACVAGVAMFRTKNRRSLAAGVTLGVLAICASWLFEGLSSPLADYYAQNMGLMEFWMEVNTLPEFASHVAEILLTGNVHIGNETVFVIVLFLVGSLCFWLLQLIARHFTKESPRGIT